MTNLPARPKDLGAAGAALWDSITSDVPAGHELDSKELATLGHAARMGDAIAALEAIVAEQGYMSTGVAKRRRRRCRVRVRIGVPLVHVREGARQSSFQKTIDRTLTRGRW